MSSGFQTPITIKDTSQEQKKIARLLAPLIFSPVYF